MLKKNINMDSVKSFKVFFILLSVILINIRNVNGNGKHNIYEYNKSGLEHIKFHIFS